MTQNKNNKDEFEPTTVKGEFVRSVSQFRHWVRSDKNSSEAQERVFPAQANRYHLYISHACPWAHRVMIFRKLKGLEKHISVDFVHPLMGARSWHFGEFPGSTEDSIYNKEYLDEVYKIAAPDYDGVVTVPLLWDKIEGTAVNNESSEIIRMFNSEFNELTGNSDDYYPEKLRPQIDEINELVYDGINNGVYRCGFASSQDAYDRAVKQLFETLDILEERLESQQWLIADQLTEADWRLFPTLIRFDAVYHGHFKCNLKRIVDYPNLLSYTQRLYTHPGIAETVDLVQIKHHYYASHPTLNPSGIIPAGPADIFT